MTLKGMSEPKPKKGQPADPKAAEAVPFEDAIRRLGQIVEQLERGDLPLEASLALFEEGTKLARLAQDRLNKAEKRIEELLSVDEEGKAVTRSFDAKIDEE
jgi:exodeoxyribonuclease VII small subunit